LKPKRNILRNMAPVVLLAGCILLSSPAMCDSQGFPSWWGSDRWWDWSDFRGSAGLRFLMPKLVSGTVKWVNNESDLLGSYNYDDRPSGSNFQARPNNYFMEGWFTLYVDRLALRAHFEEDHKFNGMIGTQSFAPWQVSRLNPSYGSSIDDPQRFSELSVGWTRFGLDLDLVRYPFLRAGINFDRHFESCIFIYRQDIYRASLDIYSTYDPSWALSVPVFVANYEDALGGNDETAKKLTTRQPPLTIGLQATAIPGRIYGIPVTAQARFRVPMPFIYKLLQAGAEARITEWEVSAGARPNVWQTSLYGYATFAMGIEAGFRSTYLDMSTNDGKWAVKANWQSAFVQVGLYY